MTGFVVGLAIVAAIVFLLVLEADTTAIRKSTMSPTQAGRDKGAMYSEVGQTHTGHRIHRGIPPRRPTPRERRATSRDNG